MSSPSSKKNEETIAKAPTGQVVSERVKTIKIDRGENPKERDVYGFWEVTLNEIDVPGQTFTVSMEFHLIWQDFLIPSLVDLEASEKFAIDEDEDGSLPLKMEEIVENKDSLDFVVDPLFSYFPDQGCVYLFFVIECTCTERMELQRFPLDRQFLNIEMNLYHSVDDGNWRWLKECPTEWCPPSLSANLNRPSVCKLSSSVSEYRFLPMYVDLKSSQIRLRVERITGFYFANVVLPNFLIVLACLSCFMVPREDIADRLSVTVTLMLTAVAFRFVVSEYLPAVNYMTWMDIYILFSFTFLTLLIAENAFVGTSSIFPDDTALFVDRVTALVAGTVWVIVNTVIACVFFSNDVGRSSWAQMDEEDANDNSEDFISAKPERQKGNDISPEAIDEWLKYAHLSPDDRAKAYSIAHPQLDALAQGIQDKNQD